MKELLASARRLCFDTNAVIYYLDRAAPYSGIVQRFFREVHEREREAVLSTVTELELLVRPIREGDNEEVEKVRMVLAGQGVRVIALDREIARAAATVRANTGLRLPDAAIVATALVTGCDVIVGNDARCAKRVTEVRYVLLDDLVREAGAAAEL